MTRYPRWVLNKGTYMKRQVIRYDLWKGCMHRYEETKVTRRCPRWVLCACMLRFEERKGHKEMDAPCGSLVTASLHSSLLVLCNIFQDFFLVNTFVCFNSISSTLCTDTAMSIFTHPLKSAMHLPNTNVAGAHHQVLHEPA